MRSAHQHTALSAITKHPQPLGYCRFGIFIKTYRDTRMGELHRRHVNQIPQQQQFFTLAFHQIDAVAWRMPMGGKRTDPRRQLTIITERFKMSGGLIRLERGDNILERGFLLRRRLFQPTLAKPKIRILLPGTHHCIWKSSFTVLRQTAEMIRVHMRQVNFIHLLWLIAGSLEVYDQFAQPVPQQRTRTGINQDQLAAGIDQVSINRGDDRQALMVLGQSGLYLLWRTVEQHCQPASGARHQTKQ